MNIRNIRIGHGYDLHRLEYNRRLVLGGVEIPYEKGLLGHSDADVLLHAVMDAVLGALALGDIGKLFPDNDKSYKNIDSMILCERVYEVMRAHNMHIGNIDTTVIAQAPKLSPHTLTMRKNIARVFGCFENEVSVKATTEEHLGITGDGSAISAHAVVLLIPDDC